MVHWTSLDVVLDIMSVIAAIITTSLSSSMYYNHYKHPKNFHLKLHKRIATFSITCYTISMITMSICYNFGDTDKASLDYIVAFLIYVFFWGFGICSSYLLFILRLKTTFKSSAYDSSIYVYISLYLSIIIWIICHVILVLIELFGYYNIISMTTTEEVHFAELSIKCILSIYISFTLTYLFVSKLMLMRVRAFDGNERKEPLISGRKHGITLSTAVQQPIIKLDIHDVTYLNIATKMTVLSTIMAISSVAVICVALASILLDSKSIGGVLWYFIAMLGLMIDSMINVFCIYLTFPYSSSRKMYKMLCEPTFHRCCYYISKKKFEKKIHQKMNTTEMEKI